jgi:hypothetical protein
MMKRKFLGLAVTIGALAVIVSALALQSATVTNLVSVPITTTGSSLISIVTPAAPVIDSDLAYTVTSGQAVISLVGANGLQPGSSYTLTPAFNVKNNSANSVAITLGTGTLPTGVTVSFVNENGVAIVGPTTLANAIPTLKVGFKIDVDTTAALVAGASLPVTVSAVAN